MNDGGTAFPVMDDSDGRLVVREFGMSMRDYFAAKALQGIMSDDGMRPSCDAEMGHLAKKLYQMADAMLAERAKPVPA